MKIYPHLPRLFCLLIFALPVFAQDQKTKKPPPLIAKKKKLTSQFVINNQPIIGLKGKATFQVLQCNQDLSLTGIFTYQIDDHIRQKIAQTTKRDIRKIPTKIEQKNVITEFAKNTDCPVVKLDFKAMEFNLVEAKIRFHNFSLNWEDNQQGNSFLMCRLTYAASGYGDINIQRINELLIGDKPK